MKRRDWRLGEDAEEIRERMQHSARNRKWPSKIRSHGVTEAQYLAEIAKGNKWCIGHRAFEPCSEFSQPEKSRACRKFIREYSSNRYRALSAEEKTRIYERSKRLENPERRKKRYVWHMFRITLEQYADMLQRQGGKCAICYREPKGNRLAVDHDHSCCKGKRSCGKCVRGLLCSGCNRKVAIVEYNPALFARAQEYLQRYSIKEI